MGREKGFLEFDGVPLIAHTARLIEPLVAEVTVVGPPRRYAALGLNAIADQGAAGRGSKRNRRGPLAGIGTALAATCSTWNLIVACDMPYLSEAWLDWLLSRAIASRGQVVIPWTGRGLEPLAAVYRRECGGPIASALAQGVRKVTDAIEGLRMDVVDRREWRGLDPSGLVLKNMNRPGDYVEARKWWSAETKREGHTTGKAPAALKRRRRSAALQK
jgi:molybdenum cofactor guanylyltransferase